MRYVYVSTSISMHLHRAAAHSHTTSAFVTKWHVDVSIFGAQMLESCFRIMRHINIVSFITQSEGDGTTSTSTDRRGKCDLKSRPRPFPIE